MGDEIAVPVGVFNYLTEEQSVRLEVHQADWFELLDEPVQEITIAANDISVVYFRIRATGFRLAALPGDGLRLQDVGRHPQGSARLPGRQADQPVRL